MSSGERESDSNGFVDFDPFFVLRAPPFSTSTSLQNSTDDDASDDITIPLPAVRRRELVSLFGFCARQLADKDELERIRKGEEEREEREERARGQRRSRSRSGDGGAKAAAASSSSSSPSAASLSLALRASLDADAAAWAASSPATGGHRGLLGRTLAANYLDVPSALSACADAVAAGVRGRAPTEIRARFGIANDLSREEEEAIKADCAWAFDCC